MVAWLLLPVFLQASRPEPFESPGRFGLAAGVWDTRDADDAFTLFTYGRSDISDTLSCHLGLTIPFGLGDELESSNPQDCSGTCEFDTTIAGLSASILWSPLEGPFRLWAGAIQAFVGLASRSPNAENVFSRSFS